ncbi:MAG: hypothetical protein HQ559_10375 [Lentisphaerae bacterium]|nr:hypothetical protein [Lentisphaerota bacterium]
MRNRNAIGAAMLLSCPQSKTRIRGAPAAVLVAFALAAAASAAEPVYARLPTWWDSVSITIPEEDPTSAGAHEFWNALSDENPIRGTALEKWHLIGPFDGARGRGLDIVYTPEKTVRRRPTSGKDGRQVEWTAWKADQPLPVPRRTTDAVFYAFVALTAEEQREGCLIVTADDGAKLWINDKLLLARPNFGARDVVVPVTFSPGRNRILVKIHQEDDVWGFRLGWSATDERKREIKLRSLVCSRFPNDPQSTLRHARKLAVLYAQLGDTANAGFWTRYIFAKGDDPAFLRPVLDVLVDEAPKNLAPLLAKELELAYNGADDNNTRDAFASYFVRHAFASRDPASVIRFLHQHKIPVSLQNAVHAAALFEKNGDPESADHWIDHVLKTETGVRVLCNFVPHLATKSAGESLEHLYQVMRKAYGAVNEDHRNEITDRYLATAFEARDPRAAALFLHDNRIPASREQARALIRLYADTQRDEAAFQWVKYYLLAEKDRKVCTSTIHNLAGLADEATQQFLYAELGAAFRMAEEKKDKDFFAAQMIELGLSRWDRTAVTRFLEESRWVVGTPDIYRIMDIQPLSEADSRVGRWLTDYFLATRNAVVINQVLARIRPMLQDAETHDLLRALGEAISETTDTDHKEKLTEFFVREALSRADSAHLGQILESQKKLLASDLKFEGAILKTLSMIMNADHQGARDALRLAVEHEPDFENSKRYHELDRRIFEMKTSPQGPAVIDLSRHKTIRELRRYAARSGATALHRLILETLLEKGDACERDSQDRMLYTGVKDLYRKDLADYRESYDEYLADHIRKLLEKGGAAADAARFRQSAASLELLQPGRGQRLPETTLDMFRPGKTLAALRPLIKMEPGLFELRAMETSVAIGGDNPRCFNVPARDGTSLYLQNSRAAARITAGRVTWSRAIPCAATARDDDPRYLGSVRSPVIVGDLLVGRFLSDESMVLAGLNKDTGEVRWIFLPEDATLTSDPAWWNGSLCLVQATHDGTEGEVTLLLIVDANLGKELFRLKIARLVHPEAFDKTLTIDFSRNMPAPVIADDVAYLDTLNGTVAAVSLSDRSLVWLRTYPRKFDASVSGHSLSRPLIGFANVLFAPSDSDEIMLVDRATGSLVSRNTGVEWKQVRSAGSNAAVVISSSGATFRSLDDLGVTGEVKRPGLRYLQACIDGCLVYDAGSVRAYVSTGEERSVTGIPPGVLPVLWMEDGICAFSEEIPGLFGFLTAETTGNDPPPEDLHAPLLRSLSEATSVAVPRGVLLKCRDFLTYFDPSGTRRWDKPILRNSRIWFSEGRIVIYQTGTITFRDLESGEWTGAWPSPRESKDLEIRQVVRSGDVPYAEVGDKADDKSPTALYRVPANKPAKRVGLLPKGLEALHVLSDGEYVLRPISRYSLGLFQLDSVTNTFNRVREFKATGGGTVKPIVFPDGEEYWVFDQLGWKGWQCRGGEAKEVTIPGDGRQYRSATWTFTGLPGGKYTVYGTWSAHANRAGAVPFTIHDGDRALGTFSMNQELPPDDLVGVDGGDWERIGPAAFPITSGTLKVLMMRVPNEDGLSYVMADAIRLSSAALGDEKTVIIDNGDEGFHSEWNTRYAGQGYQNNQVYHITEHRVWTDTILLDEGLFRFSFTRGSALRWLYVNPENLAFSRMRRVLRYRMPMPPCIVRDRRLHVMDLSITDKKLGFKSALLDFTTSESDAGISKGRHIPDPFDHRGMLIGSVALGGKIIYPYYTTGWRSVFDLPHAYAIVQEEGGTDTTMVPFPLVTDCRQISDRYVMLNETLVDSDSMDAYLNWSNSVRTAPDPFRAATPFVDGYLDEWGEDEFVAVANGRYAVRRKGTDIWIGIELTDADVIDQLALHGADENILFYIAPGAKAGFVQDAEAAGIVYRSYTHQFTREMMLRAFDEREDRRFAYSIDPAATLCQIEIFVKNVQAIPGSRSDGTRPSLDTETCGDMAFRLHWRRGPWYPQMNLLEKSLYGPLSFTRTLFTYEHAKP